MYGVVYSIYRSFERDYPNIFKEHYVLFSTTLMIAKAIKLITNMYLHFVFIQVLKFLIQYRSLVYGRREIETNEPQK